MDHIDFFWLWVHTGAMSRPAASQTLPSRFSRLPHPVALELAAHPLLAALQPVSAGYRQGHDPAIGYNVRRAGGEYLLQYCCGGRGHFTAGSGTWTIRPGDLVILEQPADHAYRADPADPWAVWWTYFTGSEAAAWVNQLAGPAGRSDPVGPQAAVPPAPGARAAAQAAPPLPAAPVGRNEAGGPPAVDQPTQAAVPPAPVRVLHLGSDPALETAFLQLLADHEAGYAPHRMVLAAARLRLVLALCLARSREQAGTGPRRRNLENLVDWMRANLDRHPGLDDFAQRYGTCRDHCIRDFKAAYGYTPMDYFLRLKIQRAAELMVVRGLGVSQTAASLGFDDPAYFSRLFRRKTGLSPREFRQRHG